MNEEQPAPRAGGTEYEVARRRCLNTTRAGSLGDPFAPPWFDPGKWRFDENGRLYGYLEDGLRPEGYHDMVHGGAIAGLVDAAMTHCLFGHGVMAVTAELSVRYRKPLGIGHPVEIAAEVKETVAGQVYRLSSQVIADGEVKAEAHGTFFRSADVSPPLESL